MLQPLSLPHAIRWWARTTPDALAISVRGDELTYAELDAWIDRVAERLRQAGVAPGDSVGLVGNNCIEWPIVYLAAMRVGALATPFNQRLVAAELKPLIELCEPSVLVVADTHIERVKAATTADGAWSLESIADLRTGEKAPEIDIDIDPDAPSIVVFTSGTTGLPKAAIFTQNTVMSQAMEWGIQEPSLGHGVRVLSVLPLAPTGGVWSLSQTLLHGGQLYLEPKFEPAIALDILEQKKIKTLFGPPIIFEQIALAPGFADADLSSLVSTMVGGAAVPVQLLKTWQKKGVRLRQCYGLTESGGTMFVMSPEGAMEHPELCGRGGMFSHVRVVREDGTDCDAGEIGEIIIRRPSMTPGYYRNPEATAALIRDGWLHTGDMARFNEDGYLEIVDRLKDLVISGGFNIGPSEIEWVISQLPNVVEVSVIGAKDEKFGQVPAALVRFEEGKALGPEEIVAYCNERLADFKVPRYVVVLDEPLPRNANMKILKPELRKQYADIHERYDRVR